jgi:membrane protein
MGETQNSPKKQKISFKGLWKLIKDSLIGFDNDKVFKLSGSLAYFTIFSIGPMLLVMIFFADIFYGREAVEGTIYGYRVLLVTKPQPRYRKLLRMLQ